MSDLIHHSDSMHTHITKISIGEVDKVYNVIIKISQV
jgi:hypothetical protein